MTARKNRPSFENPALQREIMNLRQVDNWTDLAYLAAEYLSLAAVIAMAVIFAEYRASWGWSWGWNVPVFGVAIVLIGGIQHRLAGLGHEAAHYTFLKNRFLNDFIPDIFCMFPLFTTVQFYRVFHLAHHQYTNDPARDPDLQNLGHGKRAFEFPMNRFDFIRRIYFAAIVAPARVFRYQWAYIQVNVLGQGRNVYVRQGREGADTGLLPRLGTIIGLAYILSFNALSWLLTTSGHEAWLMPAAIIAIALMAIGTYAMPDSIMFRSPLRQAYSERFEAVVRLTFYILLLAGLAKLRIITGGASTKYTFLLWLVPLGTSFMFFMFLRDVYQHSNADDGRLTNSRVFFTDPFTRWAVFVYGQDMHIPHHLFPAIPHHRLRELHELLKRNHDAYRDLVIETHGTFHDRQGRTTILDEMSRVK
jgi:fatty acid desaturase